MIEKQGWEAFSSSHRCYSSMMLPDWTQRPWVAFHELVPCETRVWILCGGLGCHPGPQNQSPWHKTASSVSWFVSWIWPDYLNSLPFHFQKCLTLGDSSYGLLVHGEGTHDSALLTLNHQNSYDHYYLILLHLFIAHTSTGVGGGYDSTE